MADLSFSFDPAQVASNSSNVIVNTSAASDAASAAAVASDLASSALVKAVAASGAVGDGSDALSKITARSTTWDKASDASSLAATVSNATSSLGQTVIKSIPTSGSRAVHEILMTSAGLVKYVYSSVAKV